MIHLQLQSAKLMPLGLIDESTIVWEEFEKTERKLLQVTEAVLASLTGSQDVALTGLELFHNEAEGFLNLRIVGRRFDFKTGRLESDEISKNLTRSPKSHAKIGFSFGRAIISLKAPLAVINIMEVSGKFTPTAVALDYRRLLELNVVSDMQNLTSGSTKAEKIHFVLFLFVRALNFLIISHKMEVVLSKQFL